ncbi:hypothetical protein [Pseudonocardia sp.]|uniref:hypothetical protein n=1 Tax=Pseudonocardia sp. TaxID=60912 RepID=UPI003D0B56FE
METSLRREGAQVASTLEDLGDTISDVADALRAEAGKVGADLRAGLVVLPDQLEEVRHTVLAAVEPYRPPRQYRRYVQIGVLVVVVAAVAAMVVRSRRAAETADATGESTVDQP